MIAIPLSAPEYRRPKNADGSPVPACAYVDDEIAPLVSRYRWQMNRGGYAQRVDRNGDRRTLWLMHRWVLGSVPDGMVVHHINGNKRDNRRENLRVCTQAENLREASAERNEALRRAMALRQGKPTGLRYRPDYSRRPWGARITVAGRRREIGWFATEAEALAAIRAAQGAAA